MYQKDIV